MGSDHPKRNVFVVGLDEFNLRLLEDLPSAPQCRFLPLLSPEEMVWAESFDLPALLAEARAELDGFGGSVDAIVGYWDFPTTLMLPILRRERGLPGPGLESVLRCEHKYWSRLLQAEVLSDQVPPFRVFDPFSEDFASQIDLPFPFWVKPVKAHSSQLGFAVHGMEDLARAIEAIRQGVERVAVPFDHILSHAELPPEVAWVRGHHCLAEAMIGTDWQCTVEGWVQGGRVATYGVVDSLRSGWLGSSFTRYQYPSRLPPRVQQDMGDAVERLVRHVGLSDAPFNAEFFYDEVTGRLGFLEINARVSKSHSPLFARVDGVSNLEVMVRTGLGEAPTMPAGGGPDRTAAKFMVRLYEDGVVVRAPTAEELSELALQFPDVDIQVHVEPGMRLSELPNQDSYSYELATLFMGGPDEGELVDRYHRCLERLFFEVRSDADAYAHSAPWSPLP
jgi:hypothetical protein